MTTWVQPNCFESKKFFQSTYLDPIVQGSCSDSHIGAKARQRKATEDLHKALDGFVQRRSSQLLLKDLPPMQQAVIVVRRSRIQQKLQKVCPHKKFLEWYSLLRPVFNHPGTLLPNSSCVSNTVIAHTANGDDSSAIEIQEDDYSDTSRSNDGWWKNVLAKFSNPKCIEYGAKMVILLQILAHSELLGEKVVVFSQCLKTLDYIEEILNHPNWAESVVAIKDIQGNKVMGNWVRNRDYLRIDGSHSASKRGSLVSSFKSTDSLKAFLISTRAGGIGINLTNANRIVLMDSGWNPSVEEQAVYRCYRYGQVGRVGEGNPFVITQYNEVKIRLRGGGRQGL